MPIYRYKTTDKGCPHCQPGFDQLQAMSAQPLARCPKCQGPVKKIPASFHGGTPMLSDANLRDHGFTKLVKRDKGTYEKTT